MTLATEVPFDFDFKYTPVETDERIIVLVERGWWNYYPLVSDILMPFYGNSELTYSYTGREQL